MTIKRMDNVLIVVDDLDAVQAFFIELGLTLEGETTVEGPDVGRLIGLDNVRATLAMLRTPDGQGIELEGAWPRGHWRDAVRGVLPVGVYPWAGGDHCRVGGVGWSVIFVMRNGMCAISHNLYYVKWCLWRRPREPSLTG